MGMMTGCRWRRGAAALLLTLSMATTAGCDQRSLVAADSPNGSTAGVDANGRQACAEFRAGWRQATDASARLLLADAVGRPARRSDNVAIAEGSATLGRSAKDGGRAWQVAAADLEHACRQAGPGTDRPRPLRPGQTSAPPPALPVTG